MRNLKVKKMAFSAMIAAIYFGCCFACPTFASGAIQCRVSEGFCLLPLFFPESILGVTIGCLIYNLTQGMWMDAVFGTLATLLACICTYYIGRLLKNKQDWLKIVLGGLPAVIFNAIIIPFVLIYAYEVTDGYWFLFGTVGLGELIAVYVVGGILYFPLKKLFEYMGIIKKPAKVETSSIEENKEAK